MRHHRMLYSCKTDTKIREQIVNVNNNRGKWHDDCKNIDFFEVPVNFCMYSYLIKCSFALYET